MSKRTPSRVREDDDLLPVIRALLHRDDGLAGALEPARGVLEVADLARGDRGGELFVELLAILPARMTKGQARCGLRGTGDVGVRDGDAYTEIERAGSAPCGRGSRR